MPAKINFAEKLSQFSDHWNPRIIAAYNGNDFRVVKIQGEFVWHCHDETDECFVVLKGQLRMGLRDGDQVLNPGEMIVIPKGVEHCPSAAEECHVLVVDREGTKNTGNVDSDLTRQQLERI